MINPFDVVDEQLHKTLEEGVSNYLISPMQAEEIWNNKLYRLFMYFAGLIAFVVGALKGLVRAVIDIVKKYFGGKSK